MRRSRTDNPQKTFFYPTNEDWGMNLNSQCNPYRLLCESIYYYSMKNNQLFDYPLPFEVTYVLKLEDECWYVGKTKNGNVNHRINQHFTIGGAGWTKWHKPTAVYRVVKGDRELEITKLLCKKYGEDKVRGANFVKCKDPSWNHKQNNMHTSI